MKVTFDLDNVIFDMRPIYDMAFKRAGVPFEKPTSYDIDEIYNETVCANLRELWGDDILYTMRVMDKNIPYILNGLMKQPNTEVIFVTERMYKQPEKTLMQLQNAGINCTIDQVCDKHGLKSDILKELKTDLHFDDSPYVVNGCLKKQVPVVMISNNFTLYNHFLRSRVQHYKTLHQALIKTGLYKPQKTR